MIIATAKVHNPEAVQLEITIQMSIKDWLKIADSIGSTGWPNWKVASAIQRAIVTVSKTFTERIEDLADKATE